MVRLLRHRQTKGPVSARPHLNRRATPRLHRFDRWSLSINGYYDSSSFVQLSNRRQTVEILFRGAPFSKQDSLGSTGAQEGCQSVMISPPFDRLDYPSLRQSAYLNQASLGLIGRPAVTAMHTFIDNLARH